MDNRVVSFLGIALLLAGCASAPPATESVPPPPTPATLSLSEARSVVGEARSAGANVETAELFLRQAEQAQTGGDEEQARALAEKAKQAVAARRAIEDARPVVAAAVEKAGALASDATKLLDAAEAALKAGDPLRTSELAASARRQAEAAVEQKLSAPDAVSKAEQRIAPPQTNTYAVQRGDSLWTIAGRKEVYGEPLQWPLLFQANRRTVEDADLIRPGQALVIDREVTPEERIAAENHARTRGAWQVGAVEPADKAFFNR